MNFELYYGKPGKIDYDTIINMFPKNSINSVRTSSLPLLVYWKDTDKKLKKILSFLKLNSSDKYSLCFEYPTSSGAKGKASMTDLMILSDSKKIAIEAKFTEVTGKYEVIENWLQNPNKDNRKNVLENWIQMIQPFSSSELKIENIKTIPYQFLHRTASACAYYESKEVYVIYQIFYDGETKAELEKFKKEIIKAKEIINPNEKLKFYLWELEVKQCIEEADKEYAFEQIKTKNIYEFLRDEIVEI
ncbi:MAG TPA: hypothetical protein PK079_11935 [Leptospiraceae bacterium]|nr:hypothetical protein [Leptospiraceae bacterium]HMW07112.1 hypothetical protein [Leptospiraceae bacterium]HMX31786.1 hypothetical protein [Leptospiraceae bacterium]HMY32571.1 hypothetical protein [Leptospiraceae bacterium]HMZ63895.1 hypothetical protein [Leptospiraceae bacterium]